MGELNASHFIALAFMGGIAAYLGIFAIRGFRDLTALEAGTNAAGRITGKRIDDDDGVLYYVAYAFKDAGGRRHEKEIEVGKKVYDALDEYQDVGVVYRRENPRNSYLSDAGFRRAHYRTLLVSLLLAAGLCFLTYSYVDQCMIRFVCGDGD